MIKCNGGSIEIDGMGAEILAELGVIVCAVVDSMETNGVPRETATAEVVKITNKAIELSNERENAKMQM